MMWCNLQFEKALIRDGWKLHDCAVNKAFADHHRQYNITILAQVSFKFH